MRQAGILAAAGIIALTDHVERLAEDHENALSLAEGLLGIPRTEVDLNDVQTNMVFLSVEEDLVKPLQSFMKENGVLVSVSGPGRFRLVTHLDVTAADIERAIAVFRKFLKSY